VAIRVDRSQRIPRCVTLARGPGATRRSSAEPERAAKRAAARRWLAERGRRLLVRARRSPAPVIGKKGQEQIRPRVPALGRAPSCTCEPNVRRAHAGLELTRARQRRRHAQPVRPAHERRCLLRRLHRGTSLEDLLDAIAAVARQPRGLLSLGSASTRSRAVRGRLRRRCRRSVHSCCRRAEAAQTSPWAGQAEHEALVTSTRRRSSPHPHAAAFSAMDLLDVERCSGWRQFGGTTGGPEGPAPHFAASVRRRCARDLAAAMAVCGPAL
jgi:hypothetical protein